jgi:hypothetical protein
LNRLIRMAAGRTTFVQVRHEQEREKDRKSTRDTQ